MRADRRLVGISVAVIGLAVVTVVVLLVSRGIGVKDPESYVLRIFRGPETTKGDAWRIIKDPAITGLVQVR